MEELIARLQQRIEEIVGDHSQLKQSNQQLNHKKSTLVREKDALLDKQRKAMRSIEALISKLKAIEKQT